jgi:4-hydroxybenzoate polyprenyltransferase
LTSKLYGLQPDYKIIIGLFIAGIFSHIWGCYNNDRLDLSIDKKADYCSQKPLVSGTISIRAVKIIEFSLQIFVISLILIISPRISTLGYLFGAFSLAYLYNRYNKSNMFINIIGQMYASFVVLVGMSLVVNFDYIIFLSAIVIGLNGIYLNIIEADLKDIKTDIVNVPKALGLKFKRNKAVNITKFFLLNESIKIIMYFLVFYILYLEEIGIIVISIAFVFFIVNFIIRVSMFKQLSSNREKMKHYIVLQELTSILFISTIYVIVHPAIPVIIVLFVMMWLVIWNKILWGTYLRPQV